MRQSLRRGDGATGRPRYSSLRGAKRRGNLGMLDCHGPAGLAMTVSDVASNDFKQSTAAVGVFQAHDVVFAQVAAGLDFDHFQFHLAGVMQAVDLADGDVGGLVFGE